MPPDPPGPSKPWYAWADGPEPAREWPAPKVDVDVDRTRLKTIGAAMQADVGAEPGPDLEFGVDEFGGLPARFRWLLLDDFAEWSWWSSMQAVRSALVRIDEALKQGATAVHHSYGDLGGLLFATGVNYDRALELLEGNLVLLDRSVNGMGVRHETVLTREPWKDEDVSQYDASYVKQFLDSVDPRKLAAQGTLCSDLAMWFSELQWSVEGRARELAGAWKGPTSEIALEGMRKVHATCGALAYASGRTGETISWLAGVLQQYQTGFESIVELGDWELDDDLAALVLPTGGSAHDRARDLLRELNVQLAIAHGMLPGEVETLLPGIVDGSGSLSWHREDGLKDDSSYWGFLELDFQHQREDAARDRESGAAGGLGYWVPPVGMAMGSPPASGGGSRAAAPPRGGSRGMGSLVGETAYGNHERQDRGQVEPRVRPQPPRDQRERGEGDRRGYRHEFVAERQVGGGRPGADEEEPGVRPLLQPGKAGDEQREHPERLPDAQDAEQVGGVAEVDEGVEDVGGSQEVPPGPDRGLDDDGERGEPVDAGADQGGGSAGGGDAHGVHLLDRHLDDDARQESVTDRTRGVGDGGH